MKIMMKMLLLSTFMICTNAFAYKIAIYTDQADSKKAQEVIATFQKTYPFNQYDIEYEIKNVQASELDCKPLYGITRNLGCDSKNIAKDAAKRGVDQAIIVKDSTEYGGSGGSIPVMTSSSDPRMILHEYLHTLGLADEYEYSPEEAIIFCNKGAANIASFEPLANGYSSDFHARSIHSKDIPWYLFIKNTTLITHSNGTILGTDKTNPSLNQPLNSGNTPNQFASPVGLYEGKRCNKAAPKKTNWQPGGESSIMDVLAAGLGAGNEQIVAKILDSRGVRRKDPPVDNSLPISVNDQAGNKDVVRPSDSGDASNVISK